MSPWPNNQPRNTIWHFIAVYERDGTVNERRYPTEEARFNAYRWWVTHGYTVEAFDRDTYYGRCLDFPVLILL